MPELNQESDLTYSNFSFAYADNIPSPKQDLIEVLNASGIEHAENGEYNFAINKFSTAIELDPDYAGSYCNRAITYYLKGEHEKAIEDYNTAIKHKPGYAEAYYNRGTAYGIKGKTDLAIKDFNKSIKLKPDHVDAYYNRGGACLIKHDFNPAIKDFTTVIELNPDYAEAYSHRGNAYRYKGELNKAITDYSRAIVLKPKIAESYYTRGEAWLRIEKWEEAQQDLTAAILQDMNIAEVFHNTYGSIVAFEKEIGIKLPEGIVKLLTPQQEPLGIDKETRIALAMKYYENEELSSGLAARLAGVSREEFMYLMGDYGLSPFGTAEDLQMELENARKSGHQ